MPKFAPVNLTDLKVKALRPDAAGEYVQGDTQVPGFGVRVRQSGAASYIVNKRLPGETRSTRVTIGRVGDMKLAVARDKAREAIGAVKAGVDLNVEKRRKRERTRRAEAATGYKPATFGEVAILYIRSECKALARGAEIEALIRKHFLPAWGERLLDDLRRRDLTAVLDPVVEAGRTQAAHKLREVAIRVLNWAVDRGDVEMNYLASASRGRRRAGIIRRTRRDRVLGDDEIRAIWQACDQAGHPFGDFVRLSLMLGQRREEIAGMEWGELALPSGELDRGAALWVIPASRYKTRIEHAVPLPRQAVDLIAGLPCADERFVFSTKVGTKISGYSKMKARLEAIAGVTGWRLHDLRRTMRTNMAALRVDPDIAERVLGHVIAGVRGVYDRYAYIDQKREALERWAQRLQAIVEPPPPNVVELRSATG